MAVKKKQLFVIAGPNGAGKTTSAMKLLPDFLECEESTVFLQDFLNSNLSL